MRFSGLTKTILLAALVLLAGCLTVADSVMTRADLIELSALEDIEGERKISLEIVPPERQKVSLAYEQFLKMHFDYSAALVDSVSSGLSVPFEITDPAADVPHVIIAMDRIYGRGFCRTIGGNPSYCSQTVKFSAWISVDNGNGPTKPVSINSTGSASDDSFFSAISVFEPLHKRAAQRAFERFLRAAAEKINEIADTRTIDMNQSARAPTRSIDSVD